MGKLYLEINELMNECDDPLPQPVIECLEKGPKFRVPPQLNDRFVDKVKTGLEILTRDIYDYPSNQSRSPRRRGEVANGRFGRGRFSDLQATSRRPPDASSLSRPSREVEATSLSGLPREVQKWSRK